MKTLENKTQEQIQAKLIADNKRVDAISDELFELANSYAGDKFGHIAQTLHQANNCCITASHKLIVESARLLRSIRLEQSADYENYSYYVGGEITCNRMPMKFGPWITLRDKKIEEISDSI